MFLSLNDFFSDESAVIQVDSSVIDVSEFKDEGDQSFLISHGSEILRIGAKAEYAKEQIVKAIDQQANDAKGQHIYEIQERFKNTPALKGGLMRYFHSLGFWNKNMEKMGLEKQQNYVYLETAFTWANAYRAALEMQEKLRGLYSPEEIQSKVAALPPTVLGKAYGGLAEVDRESLYLQAANGQVPSHQEVISKMKSPEAKLNKARELLEEAKERVMVTEEQFDLVKDQPDRVDGERNRERQNAAQNHRNAAAAVERYEKKIADLEAILAKKDTELDKFKFDDETRREQRIKSLTAGLTIGVPQTIADLQKYFTESEYYPEKLRHHLDDQVKMLADLCGDYLAAN